MVGINYIVYTPDLRNSLLLAEYNCEKIEAFDARSAVYFATGIAAQKKEMVLVFVDSSNASRSSFSGMTEAFYRKLPVVLVTFGNRLDYSRELNDVVNSHMVVDSVREIESVLVSAMPMHIEVRNNNVMLQQKTTGALELLKRVLHSNDYLYFGQNILLDRDGFECKVVQGGIPNCMDGSLANVLGASLAKLRRRYVGVVSEDEFIHDLNTIGNSNVNDLLLFVVICSKKQIIISDYAKNLGFECYCYRENDLTIENIRLVVNNNKMSIITVSEC